MPNTSGLVSRKGLIANHDSPVVHNLREAGMIPFACTNTSELCMWYESANRVYGRTKNAYDDTKIVGGSSGWRKSNNSVKIIFGFALQE